MKKTFPLHVPNKADPRVLEAIKSDIRKYVKRERRKTLPEGFTAWQFDCKVGPSPDDAPSVTLDNVGPAIDAVALGGGADVYVEILARAGHRFAQPPSPGPLPA